jgi:hypothetical protein
VAQPFEVVEKGMQIIAQEVRRAGQGGA